MSDVEINLAISGMPMPVYFITTVDEKSGKCNIMTGCYLCQVSEKPPMIGLAVEPSNYTHELIEATGEFAVNGVTQGGEWMEAINCCGTCSGRDMDKPEILLLLPNSEMDSICSMSCRSILSLNGPGDQMC